MWIDRLVRFLFPVRDPFFTLLDEIGARMPAAAAVFSELATASAREQLAAVSHRLKPIEIEADDLCHRLYARLDRAFVTPIASGACVIVMAVIMSASVSRNVSACMRWYCSASPSVIHVAGS